MNKRFILIAIWTTLLLSFSATMMTLTKKTFVHISAIHPEYKTLDSVYIDARGFPFPMWAHNNPVMSGYGEDKAAILWRPILGNWVLFTGAVLVVEVFIATVIWFFVLITGQGKHRKGSSQPAGGAYVSPAAGDPSAHP